MKPYLLSHTLLPNVFKPDETQPYSPITSSPSPSLPLSQKKPPTIYLGPDGEPLPYGLVSIEDIPQEEPHSSTYVHWSGVHFYQNDPLPPL